MTNKTAINNNNKKKNGLHLVKGVNRSLGCVKIPSDKWCRKGGKRELHCSTQRWRLSMSVRSRGGDKLEHTGRSRKERGQY